MSKENPWLLPEGIEEILPREAEWLEKQRRIVIDLFSSWGYRLVEPPLIEFLESLLVKNSEAIDLQTFKLVDQLSGRMMGVRTDITPQVARIDAHSLKSEGPERLCYFGNVLRTRAEGINNIRNPLQVGAEIYGDDSIESDLEIILLMLEVLEKTGIKNMHLDIGHAQIFKDVCDDAVLDDPQRANLFDIYQRKANTELNAFVEKLSCDKKKKNNILVLAKLSGSSKVLEQAKADYSGSKKIITALEYLEIVSHNLLKHKPDLNLHIDLAECRGFHYETGIVFSVFVEGQGQEIARGGRYNEVGKIFGRARAATGFSMDLKEVMTNLLPSKTKKINAIRAELTDDSKQIEKIKNLRENGETVLFKLNSDADDCPIHCDRELLYIDGKWVVKGIENE
ncbi:MAG: ATP phosphoribosyltransferase regulatory subunit [Pseudomonadota bacterium]